MSLLSRDVHFHPGFLVAASILLLATRALFADYGPAASENWRGIVETAGLWGSMQLKLAQQGDTWKGESTFIIAGIEQTKPIGDLKASGSEVSFTTELQAMDIHYVVSFSGKRLGTDLSGSVLAVRDDKTVTSGTWYLQLQGSGQAGENKPALPAPTGTYRVGRTSFHWKDLSRDETMTDDPQDRREVMVHIWYPANHSVTASPEAYFPDLELLKDFYSESRRTVFGTVRSDAVADAGIAPDRRPYPVVIFSPGGGMNGFVYSAVLQELASRGYIVAAIDHTFESQAVVFPDKRVVSYDENQVKDVLRFARERIEVRAADASFVLSQLIKLNKAAGMFRGRIDITRIGILGHSRGGLAAPMACNRDHRFKACLNMDGATLGGPFYPDAVPSQPFMWFIRFRPDPPDDQLLGFKMTRPQWDQNRDRIESRVNAYFQKIVSGSYRVTLDGATHLSFSDLPLFTPKLDLETLASRYRQIRIVRNYTLAFFDTYLKDQSAKLLRGGSNDYPEVTVERFEPHPR
jgi:predicted dienelactone hydrolase